MDFKQSISFPIQNPIQISLKIFNVPFFVPFFAPPRRQETHTNISQQTNVPAIVINLVWPTKHNTNILLIAKYKFCNKDNNYCNKESSGT